MLLPVQCGSWQREHVGVSSTRTCLRKSQVLSFPCRIYVLTGFLFWSLHNPALGDATAPLYCAILFNAMNILLNYLFVSKWRLLGIVQGVPILTAVAQTVSLIPLLHMLRKRLGTFVSVTDSPRNKKIVTISETLMSILASLRQYFLAGVYLMARSLVRVVTTSYCTRYAVRESILSHWMVLSHLISCCSVISTGIARTGRGKLVYNLISNRTMGNNDVRVDCNCYPICLGSTTTTASSYFATEPFCEPFISTWNLCVLCMLSCLDNLGSSNCGRIF